MRRLDGRGCFSIDTEAAYEQHTKRLCGVGGDVLMRGAVHSLVGLVCPLLVACGGLPPGARPQVYDGEWIDIVEPGPDEPLPYPPKTQSWKSPESTILVSISSFRDFRCPLTLFNLFSKAQYPDRVRAGVVQQNQDDDEDCLYHYCVMIKQKRQIHPVVDAKQPTQEILRNCPHWQQVRILRVQAEDSKGPTYARYLGSKLLGDEEFCMQTDAHMDFDQNWDTTVLEHWGAANNEYGILTTYVPKVEDLGKNVNERWEVPHICRVYFTPVDRMPRNEQAKACVWLDKPKMTSTWGAGFAFSKCHAERRVPADPHMPYVFDGEEFSKYARLWTRGYDTYTPHRSIVFHDYTHNQRTAKATSWHHDQRVVERSRDRIKTLLGMPDASIPRNSTEAHAILSHWDLGTKRTLRQLIEFTGLETTTYSTLYSSCGNLKWVPFDPYPDDFVLDEGDPMGLTPSEAAVTEARQLVSGAELPGLEAEQQALPNSRGSILTSVWFWAVLGVGLLGVKTLSQHKRTAQFRPLSGGRKMVGYGSYGSRPLSV